MSTFTEDAKKYLEDQKEYLLIEEMTLGVLVDISEKLGAIAERTSLSQTTLDVAS